MDAPGLSATTIARLKDVWLDDHKRWSERNLSAKSYVYVWADGVYLQARLEDEAQWILVIIGATPEGKKELLGFVDGGRESAHDWRALLLDLKRRVCRWWPTSTSIFRVTVTLDETAMKIDDTTIPRRRE